MMRFYILKTPRLVLESAPVDRASVQTMVSWLNDPEIVKFSEQRHRTHTIDTQYQYIDSFRGSNLLLGIYTESVMIGTISAHIDEPNRVANVGILIGDRCNQRKGFGHEAWAGLCNALCESGIRKIEAGCMEINRPMMRLCLHYGMMEEGRQDNHFILHNNSASLCDLVHWGKFND